MESQLQFMEQFMPESLGKGQLSYYAVCTRIIVGSIVDAASQIQAPAALSTQPTQAPRVGSDESQQPADGTERLSNLDEWWK